MTAVVVRIFLRYLAGILVARGLLTEGDGSVFASDPDLAMLIETGLGLAIAAATEWWWWLAEKWTVRFKKPDDADTDYSAGM